MGSENYLSWSCVRLSVHVKTLPLSVPKFMSLEYQNKTIQSAGLENVCAASWKFYPSCSTKPIHGPGLTVTMLVPCWVHLACTGTSPCSSFPRRAFMRCLKRDGYVRCMKPTGVGCSETLENWEGSTPTPVQA